MVIVMDEIIDIDCDYALRREESFLVLKIKPGLDDEEFHSSVCRCGELLPISVATLEDRQGEGHLFAVGIASRRRNSRKGQIQKLLLSGVHDPNPRRLFDMLAYLGTHYLSTGHMDRAYTHYKFEIESFLHSLVDGGSKLSDANTGTKSNSHELFHDEFGSSFVLMSFIKEGLEQVERHYGLRSTSNLSEVSVSVEKGLNLKFRDARILDFSFKKKESF